MIASFQKTPADTLDYDVDFSQWLDGDDVIIAATADVEGGSAVLERTDFSETQVRVWLSGGTAGEDTAVRVTAETAAGRTKEVCFRLRIRGCGSC